MKRLLVAVSLLLSISAVARGQRLSGDVIPSHYQITLAPDLKNATFAGEETIDVQVLKPTSNIVLNAAGIEFEETTVTSGSSTQTATVSTDSKAEMATLALPNTLSAGPAKIHIKFSGKLNAHLRGFYLSKTKRRNYAATQFEATDARRAFPCFDEPAMKATFDLKAVVDRGDTAIANGKIVADTPGPGEDKHTLTFATSPTMSTYLVALEVGDFQCLEGEADGTPIRVCATPDKVQLGKFALASAENILKYFNRYYGIKYPFHKLDLIALPDFAAGAMENTGAITYRESILLLDERTASVGDYKRVAAVTAHEMAHQWFGDLVTMQWWDDIWLNEGFATWMADKPLIAWKPQWNVWPTQGPLAVDALQATRPIHVSGSEANTPAQIGTLFDGIAYQKTAAVLYMLESWLGPETFRQGVNLYLEKHAYGNTRAADFWNAMTRASGKPVDKVMATWVEQPGAPVIGVNAACKGNQTTVELSQTRFFDDPARMGSGRELWQIPVCIKTAAGGEARCELMTRKQQKVQLQGCAPWVFVNAGGRGYYWSSYSPALSANLAKVAEPSLTPPERVSLLEDEWALARAGQHPITQFFSLGQSFRQDRTPQVVRAIAEPVEYAARNLVSDADQPAFRAWVQNEFRPLYSELGWKAMPGDSDDLKSLRPTVISVLGFAGRDPEVLRQAREVAGQYMQDPSSVDANVSGVALDLAALNGDAKLYDAYLEHMKAAKTPQELYSYMSALTQFPQADLAERTLAMALSPDIRTQDMFREFGGLFRNPQTRELTWKYFKSHWPGIENKLGAGLGFGFGALAGSFCSDQARQDVQQWFAQHPDPGGPRSLRLGMERLDGCVRMKSEQAANLAAWLKRQQSEAGK